MRKFVVIGAVLGLCVLVVPTTVATARGARAAGVRAGRTSVSAPAGTPTLTANPSTGLLDGQHISVSGSGFGARVPVGIVECQAGATDQSTCDLDTLLPVESNGSGSFTVTFTAFRVITVGESTVDCAHQACVLGAADENDANIVGDTPISFADVTIVPPTLSAVPATGLRDEQKITVHGTNYSPGGEVVLSECQAPPNEANCDFSTFAVVQAGPTGTLSTRYRVTRVITPEASPIDCAQPDTCILTAANIDNATQTASTPITFADVTIKPPKLSASPSTNLDDGQDVTVTGKNFRPHDPVGISECPAGSTEGYDCVIEGGLGNADEVRANHSGTFTLTFNVARVITLLDGTVDCAQAPGCVIGAVDLNDPFSAIEAAAPLAFNPSVPPLPPLNLEVHVNPKGSIVAGPTAKANAAAISGTVACDRTSAVPAEFDIQVTEPVDGSQAGGDLEGAVTCMKGGAKFTIVVPATSRRHAPSFVPGLAGVLFEVAADSGSSSEDTTTNASVTLKAPKS